MVDFNCTDVTPQLFKDEQVVDILYTFHPVIEEIVNGKSLSLHLSLTHIIMAVTVLTKVLSVVFPVWS